MQNSDWKDKTWSYAYLKENSHMQSDTIINWLKAIGIIPAEVKWRRSPMSVYNGLDGNAIKAQSIAELAYEFDILGYGTPEEYVDWIEYEIKGHHKRDSFMAALSMLGRRGPNKVVQNEQS